MHRGTAFLPLERPKFKQAGNFSRRLIVEVDARGCPHFVAHLHMPPQFELISAIGIMGCLLFSTASFRPEAKTRRIANLLSITANHREVWRVFVSDKALVRVLSAFADIAPQAVTEAEQAFVTLVFAHISSVYYAMNDQLVINDDGLRRDIVQFLSLPIPRAVWEKSKCFRTMILSPSWKRFKRSLPTPAAAGIVARKFWSDAHDFIQFISLAGRAIHAVGTASDARQSDGL